MRTTRGNHLHALRDGPSSKKPAALPSALSTTAYIIMHLLFTVFVFNTVFKIGESKFLEIFKEKLVDPLVKQVCLVGVRCVTLVLYKVSQVVLRFKYPKPCELSYQQHGCLVNNTVIPQNYTCSRFQGHEPDCIVQTRFLMSVRTSVEAVYQVKSQSVLWFRRFRDQFLKK